MPTNIPSGYAQCAIEYSGPVGTEPYVMTFGLDVGDYAFDTYVELADDIFDTWETFWLGYVSDDLTFERVRLTITLGGVTGSVTSTRDAVQGSAGGTDRVPTAMAAIATKAGGLFGRANRGRTFLVGILTDGSVDESGNIVEATRASYAAIWSDFIDNLAAAPGTGINAPMVILHANGSTPTPVLSGTIATKVGWIRKRLR